MVTIVTGQRNKSSGTLITTATRTGGGGPNLASGLAQGIAAIGEAIEQRRDQADNALLQKEVAAAQLEETKSFDQASNDFDGSAPGFSDAQEQRFRSQWQSRADAIENERVRDRFLQLADREVIRVREASQRIELARTSEYAFRQTQETARSLGAIVLTDPSHAPVAEQQLTELAENIPAVLRDQFLREERAKLVDAELDGLVRQDPYGLVREIEEGRFAERASAPQLDAALKSADVRIRRIEAEAGRKQALQDVVARFEMDAAVRDNIASVAATGVAVQDIDVAELARLHGPKAALTYQSNLEAAQESHTAIAGLQFESLSDISARIESLRPRDGEAGFAKKQQIFEHAARVADQVQSARLADPAAYYAQVDDQLGSLYEAHTAALDSEDTSQAATIFNQIAQRQQILQQEGGVPDRQHRLLTEGQARAQVAEVMDAPVGERALRLRDLVAGLDLKYGAAADDVLAELQAANLPTEARALRALSFDPVTSTRVAEGIAAREEVKSQIDKDDRRDVEGHLLRQMEELNETFMASSADGVVFSDSLRDALTAGAEYLVVKEGLRPKAAAKVISEKLLDEYHIGDGYRIPVRFNRRDVIEGADRALDDVVSSDGAALAPLGGSPDAPLTNAQRRKLYADFVRQGSWVTNEDETGLILVDPFGNPVRHRNEGHIEIDFGELAFRGEQ